MKEQVVLDISGLTSHGSGTASPAWWGTLAFMLIEGTGFALAIVIYFYLMSLAPVWPIVTPLPDLTAGTLMTGVLIASLIPNALVSRWAKKKELSKVRLGLLVMFLLGVVPLIIRIYEFPAMHVGWDRNAYGSVVWLLLGLHTTHILTDIVETMVLTCLMFTRHSDNPRRYDDVADNAMYWNFVVLTWLPIYACLYWAPRL